MMYIKPAAEGELKKGWARLYRTMIPKKGEHNKCKAKAVGLATLMILMQNRTSRSRNGSVISKTKFWS
ncbi:hypothetical protein PITCH_A1150114 [uncultured Desulfobacterium sp.]|uniref:Uncharacterized protein n=1 Tax=uncultured Desulfobacterium sp. TaxID=201089 RepID=A0A445MRL9_9BACT|nr:hypothetical protein PITCH_A1150114 [uncultured Desulfobacterium sp.]